MPAKHEPINDIVPFLAFVETHPVGSTIDATVAAYSSHGAYVTYGDVRGYVPLRYMADPAPAPPARSSPWGPCTRSRW